MYGDKVHVAGAVGYSSTCSKPVLQPHMPTFASSHCWRAKFDPVILLQGLKLILPHCGSIGRRYARTSVHARIRLVESYVASVISQTHRINLNVLPRTCVMLMPLSMRFLTVL